MDEKEIERKIEELTYQSIATFGGILIFGALAAFFATLGRAATIFFGLFFVPIGVGLCMYALFKQYKLGKEIKEEVKQ